jgi:hypothetical protein
MSAWLRRLLRRFRQPCHPAGSPPLGDSGPRRSVPAAQYAGESGDHRGGQHPAEHDQDNGNRQSGASGDPLAVAEVVNGSSTSTVYSSEFNAGAPLPLVKSSWGSTFKTSEPPTTKASNQSRANQGR